MCYKVLVIIKQITNQFCFLIVKRRQEIIIVLNLGQRDLFELATTNPWATRGAAHEDMPDEIRKYFTGSCLKI